MKRLIAVVALAAAAFATPASAGGWDPCNPLFCVVTRPVGVPHPVGTPYPVYRSQTFFGGSIVVQRRARVVVREHVRVYWLVRGDRYGNCWRVYD